DEQPPHARQRQATKDAALQQPRGGAALLTFLLWAERCRARRVGDTHHRPPRNASGSFSSVGSSDSSQLGFAGAAASRATGTSTGSSSRGATACRRVSTPSRSRSYALISVSRARWTTACEPASADA